MSFRDLLKLWRNAIHLSHRANDEVVSTSAEKVIAAIEREWQMRSAGGYSEQQFSWPSTAAAKGGAALFEMPPDLSDGMLSYLEYRVGQNAEPTWARQALLERVVTGVLPPVFPAPYMREWGTPGSPIRLQKIAECLAAFARNAKRRNTGGLDDAITQWEQDLAFLHDTFYRQQLRFHWPTSVV